MTNNIILLYSLLTLAALVFILLGLKWRWVYLAVIIPGFILPGLSKMFDAHFVVDTGLLCKNMCDLSPVQTVFYFFSYSRMFIRTAGFVQFMCGLFLCFRKFRFIGLIGSLGISLFISLLNISFWGMSTVAIFMCMLSVSILLYLYKDYREKLRNMLV